MYRQQLVKGFMNIDACILFGTNVMIHVINCGHKIVFKYEQKISCYISFRTSDFFLQFASFTLQAIDSEDLNTRPATKESC